MELNILEFISAILIGILTSFLAWFFLNHIFVPLIEFLPNIFVSQTSENPSGFKYKIKFRNIGRRSIIDYTTIVKISITGLNKNLPHLRTAVYIPIDTVQIPKIPTHHGSNKRLSIVILVSEIDKNVIDSFPLDIREKFASKKIRLEDLFDLGSESTLQVFAFGYDSFSGARKLFESPIYRKEDIKLQN